MQTNSNSQTKFYKAMDSWLNASSIILTTPKFKNSYIKKTGKAIIFIRTKIVE